MMDGCFGEFCCHYACGICVPLQPYYIYSDPTGDGKSFINFNLAISPLCGIPIARVLQGNLEGLEGRDELARLNPGSSSMRLWIRVSGHSPVSPSRELTCVQNGPATKILVPRLAQE